MREEFWNAIVECNKQYDSTFYYGVMSTKIFCRPSCRSKTPKKQNVKIFYDKETAMEKGFRACKRCRPDLNEYASTKEQLVNQTIQYINSHLCDSLTLTTIANHLFVSPFYLQKIFKEATGISPSQYLVIKRMEKAKALLVHSKLTITQIAFEVGFKNSAHFSSVFKKRTLLSPSAYRS